MAMAAQFPVGQFFRGDAAVFGGLEYQISPKLGFKAEYSSICLPDGEPLTPAVDYQASPLNFGRDLPAAAITWN